MIASAISVVADGRAEGLSAWVNEALRAQVARDQRRAAVDAFIADLERDHGEIADSEIAAAGRAMRSRAVVVHGA